MKSIFSFGIICIFLLSAMASFGPDQATNTTVPISDCESKPPFSGSIKVDLFLTSFNLVPIPDHDVIIFVSHQEVNPDTTCTFQSTMFEVPLVTNLDGEISWFGPEFTHDNSEDLWRVQLKVLGDENWDPVNDVQVLKYNQVQFSFFLLQLHKDDL